MALNWCTSATILVDTGMPGAANAAYGSPSVDDDGDGYSEIDGDCDGVLDGITNDDGDGGSAAHRSPRRVGSRPKSCPHEYASARVISR